jgi:hypothetical protein
MSVGASFHEKPIIAIDGPQVQEKYYRRFADRLVICIHGVMFGLSP